MNDTLENNPVYFHDCPIFGKDTKVTRALVTDDSNNYVLYYQYKCLCNYKAGEKELAPGITETNSGYKINLDEAIKLHNGY